MKLSGETVSTAFWPSVGEAVAFSIHHILHTLRKLVAETLNTAAQKGSHMLHHLRTTTSDFIYLDFLARLSCDRWDLEHHCYAPPWNELALTSDLHVCDCEKGFKYVYIFTNLYYVYIRIYMLCME